MTDTLAEAPDAPDAPDAVAAREPDPDDYGRTGEPGERATEGSPYVRPSRLATFGAVLVALWVVGGPSILVVIAAVLVMIFLHELGHFVMARRAGMKVTEFMIGFGPRIWSFRRGEVEYGLKAIPLGAYVKIIGMANIETVPPEDEPRTYRQKTYGQRFGVAVAGSTMHFILALVLTFAAMVGFGSPGNQWWSVAQVSDQSAADAAGVAVGDELVSLDGVALSSFGDMAEAARDRPGRTVDLVVRRDGEELTLTAPITARMQVFGTVDEDLDLYQAPEGQVRMNVGTAGVVADAGIGDAAALVAVDGRPVGDLDDVRAAVSAARDGRLELTVEQDGARTERTVDLGNEVAAGPVSGFLGVGAQAEPVPVGSAVGETFGFFGDVTARSTVGLVRFFSPSNLYAFLERAVTTPPGGRDEAGPERPRSEREAFRDTVAREENRMSSIVGAVMLGEQLLEDWGAFLLFLASLNIVIGIFNLVPLPPFDGGHVAIATYERIRELLRRDGRRYFSDANKLVPVAYGVLMVVLTVGLVAIYLDLADPIRL